MNKSLLIIVLLIRLVGFAQEDSTLQQPPNNNETSISATNYLGTTDTLIFNESKYALVWSSNPAQGYYKHEYLLDKTTLENYNEMFLVEALKGKITPKMAAQMKIDELKELKKDNPVINWNLYENNNDIILDFVISDQETQYEWNLYHYTVQKNVSGQKYLVLYAYSYKDSLFTNEDLKPFFNRILENRESLITKLGEFNLPELKISE